VEVNVLGWLRRPSERRRRAHSDPAEAVAHEIRQANAKGDLDRMKDRVLEADQHYVARGGGGGVLPPP
jgi:hypothetical protein